MLYQKQENNAKTYIAYNPITECVITSGCYINKKCKRLTEKKYCQSERGKIVYQKAYKKYLRSEKGKLADRKKQAKRKRNLSFTPLMNNPFPKEIPVDYHHINDTFVVPVPRQVHKNMLGKQHRVKVNNWIEEVIGDIGVC